MRSKMFWVFRHLIISAGLFWATGIPQGIMRLEKERKDREPYEEYTNGMFARFTEKDFAMLEITPKNYHAYADSLKKDREILAKNEKYTQFIYFRDLAQIRMFQMKFYKELQSTSNGHFIMSTVEWGLVNTLHGLCLSQESFSSMDSDIAKARDYWLHDAPDPNTPKLCWTTDVIFPLLHWFLMIYLRGFPFALALFLIWKFNLKKDFDMAAYRETLDVKRAPISFGLSALLWPLVLWIDIRNRWKREMVRTEVLSRRENMLSVFSKQEEQLLELGKRMNRKEFRAHLDSLGMIQKHSFASAVLVTLFLVIVPQSLFPQKSTSIISKEKVIIMKSDYGGGGIHYDVLAKSSAVLNYGEDVKQFPEFTKRIFFTFECLYEYIFSADVGKVPLVTNRIALILI